MQVGPYTKSNKHQTPANGTRLCQNLSASVQVVERARDPGASSVSRLGWSYPDTIGAHRSALSVWILPALRQLRPLVQSMTVEAARTAAAAFFPAGWIIAICCSIYGMPDTLAYCASWRMPLHDWSHGMHATQ